MKIYKLSSLQLVRISKVISKSTNGQPVLSQFPGIHFARQQKNGNFLILVGNRTLTSNIDYVSAGDCIAEPAENMFKLFPSLKNKKLISLSSIVELEKIVFLQEIKTFEKEKAPYLAGSKAPEAKIDENFFIEEEIELPKEDENLEVAEENLEEPKNLEADETNNFAKI